MTDINYCVLSYSLDFLYAYRTPGRDTHCTLYAQYFIFITTVETL